MDRILAPNVTADMICKQRVPKTRIADKQRIDGDGATAAQGLVVFVAGMLSGRTYLEISLIRGVCVAKDRDWRTADSGITFAQVCKGFHFVLDLRKYKGGIKLEADVVDPKTGNGNESKAGGIKLAGGRGSNE